MVASFPPEVGRVPAGRGERCAGRRCPQLLRLAGAACWLRVGPSRPRALSFPAGLSARMGPWQAARELWHPGQTTGGGGILALFSLPTIRSKDDFASLRSWRRRALRTAAFTDLQKE